jgi:transcriptional regulator with XRE-family HTH domain
MRQVAKVFSAKKKNPGARIAAKELGISVPSFYNYANGTDLPRLEVLRKVQRKWKVSWELINPSELLTAQNIRTYEQLTFSFLEDLREEDVEVAKIECLEKNVLRVALKIHFAA